MDSSRNDYTRNLENTKAYLDKLGNPIVLNDVKNFLCELSLDDLENGCNEKLCKIEMANELFTLLKNLLKSSKDYLKSSDNYADLSDYILTDLHRIGSIQYETIKLWEYLEILLRLPDVRKLQNNQINKILMLINKKETNSLREYFEEIFPTEALDRIKEELDAQHDEIDLDTLAAEIIENKPTEITSFKTYFTKEKDYFNDKLIIFDDEEIDYSSGSIKQCVKGQGFLKFYTYHNFVFKISKGIDYKLTLKQIIHQSFKSVFDGGNLNPNDKFKIEKNQKFSGECKEIFIPGTYRLISKNKSAAWKVWKSECIQYIIQGKFAEYQIAIIYSNDKKVCIIPKNEKGKFKPPKYVKEEDLTYGLDQVNRMYSCSKRSIPQEKVYTEKDLSTLFKITENQDETNARLAHAMIIKEKTDQLRTEFMGEKNRSYLELLLDNLIENKLLSIDYNLLNINRALYDQAAEICNESYTYLQKTIKPEDLLKGIVIEANYSIYISKEMSLEVARTMELLKDAYVHLDRLRQKKLVLFVGNTGSGKSTVVSYILGAKLKQYINKVGDKVFEAVENAPGQISEFPKIGQSLAESETLYTQGYCIDENKNMYLADCPGFNDTRGGSYELCTNLSIDQAIKNSLGIHALVLVIPIQLFLIDRANLVYNFAVEINERFSNVFSPEIGYDTSGIYIIVTKSSQVHNQAFLKMKDGTRFNELARESREKLDMLAGSDPDLMTIESVKKRHAVWKTFQSLHKSNQIEFIDLLNRNQARKMKEKYINQSKSFDKSYYQPLMESSDMKIKFGKNIELSVHTWTKLIIDKYLQEFPMRFEKLSLLINEIQRKIDRLEEDIKGRHDKIDSCKDELNKLEETVVKLNNAHDNIELLTDELKSELVEVVANSQNTEIERMKSDIDGLAYKIKNASQRVSDNQVELSKLVQENIEFNNEVEKLIKERKDLETGYYLDNLYRYHPSPNDTTTIRNVTSFDAVHKAFEEGRDLQNSEITGTRVERECDLRGRYSITIEIERKYKLVPTDPNLRKLFEQNGKSQGFIATVESSKFEADPKIKINPEGNRVRYLLFMNYDSGSLPWITITYQIPNSSYNEARIINLTAEKEMIQNKQKSLKQQISYRENEKKQFEDELKKLNIEKEAKIADLKKTEIEIEKTNTIESINKAISRFSESIEKLKNELQGLENFEELNKNLENEKKILEEKGNEYKKLEKEKKYLSLIIFTQLKTAGMLRNLSNLIFSESASGKSLKNSVLDACEKFIISYDQNIKTLEQESKRILGLAN